MTKQREALARWVGREILPHERDLRLWLQQRLVAAAEVDDIVQECYCRFAQITDVTQIREPRAYLFTIARNLARRQRMIAAVVKFEPLADMFESQLECQSPSPERIAAAKQDLGRVQLALATLPERARQIFIMRKLDGLSQRQIAQALGVSEAVVENDASRSLRAIQKLISTPPADEARLARPGGRRARSH